MDITTIADAVAVLDYLHRRQLLCDKCGDKLVEYSNAFHRRCAGCKVDNIAYKADRVPNELERRIVGALVRWNEGNPPDEGRKDPGDAPGPAGR